MRPESPSGAPQCARPIRREVASEWGTSSNRLPKSGTSGARLDRNRIHTDVSMRTVMQRNAEGTMFVHAGAARYAHVARSPGACSTLVGRVTDERLQSETNCIEPLKSRTYTARTIQLRKSSQTARQPLTHSVSTTCATE
jgi:hypothetical protein